MNLYEVGKKVISPGPEGVTFDLTDSGAVLLIQMNRPTAREKQEFKNGLSFRFAVVDDIIFILSRMGTLPWMDSPYYRMQSANLTHIDYPEDGTGLSVHAMLVDCSTGILKAQKLIGLPTDLSRDLLDAIQAQPEIQDYDVRLQRAFSRYTTDALVDMAKSSY